MSSNYPLGVTTTETRIYREMQDSDLLVAYASTLSSVAYIRQEIETRMIERHAIAIPDDMFLCEMPKRFTYFEQKFVALKEVLSEQELAACWSAPWQETVPEHVVDHPETWTTTKVLAVSRRHGDEAMRIVESARQEGRGNLIFKTKAPA